MKNTKARPHGDVAHEEEEVGQHLETLDVAIVVVQVSRQAGRVVVGSFRSRRRHEERCEGKCGEQSTVLEIDLFDI